MRYFTINRTNIFSLWLHNFENHNNIPKRYISQFVFICIACVIYTIFIPLILSTCVWETKYLPWNIKSPLELIFSFPHQIPLWRINFFLCLYLIQYKYICKLNHFLCVICPTSILSKLDLLLNLRHILWSFCSKLNTDKGRGI